MKKTYIVPVTTEENLQHLTIIANSPDVTINNGSGTTINPTDIEVREDNAWDIWGADSEEY